MSFMHNVEIFLNLLCSHVEFLYFWFDTDHWDASPENSGM